MASIDFRKHIDNATDIVAGIVSIALVGGIGSYILYVFQNNTGGNSQWYGLLDAQTGLIQTLITILIVGAVAVVGFGVVGLIRKRGE